MTLAFVLFMISLVLAVPLRFWQYVTVIDGNTGFYTENGFIVWALAGVLFVVMVLLMVLLVREKNTMDYPFRNGTKALGLLFLLEAGLSAVIAFSGKPLITVLNDGQSPEPMILANFIIYLVLGIACLLMGFLFLLKKAQTTAMRFCLLVPVIWSLIQVWSVYVSKKPLLTISENLFSLLGYIALTLFLMSFAYCVAGFGTPKHNKRMVYFAFVGALLLAVSLIPPTIMGWLNQVKYTKADIIEVLFGVGWVVIMVTATVYVCFGVDPLLDYQALYESDEQDEDPLEPSPSKTPIAPTGPLTANGEKLSTGFTLMEGMDDSLWTAGPPVQADGVDEGYRYSYDPNSSDADDLTRKSIEPGNPFYSNPNYTKTNYQELYQTTEFKAIADPGRRPPTGPAPEPPPFLFAPDDDSALSSKETEEDGKNA